MHKPHGTKGEITAIQMPLAYFHTDRFLEGWATLDKLVDKTQLKPLNSYMV